MSGVAGEGLRVGAALRLRRQASLTHSMPIIQACEVPQNSFLNRYKAGTGFADCYVTEVPGAIRKRHLSRRSIPHRYSRSSERSSSTLSQSRQPTPTPGNLPKGRPGDFRPGTSRVNRPRSCCWQTTAAARGPGSWRHRWASPVAHPARDSTSALPSCRAKAPERASRSWARSSKHCSGSIACIHACCCERQASASAFRRSDSAIGPRPS